MAKTLKICTTLCPGNSTLKNLSLEINSFVHINLWAKMGSICNSEKNENNLNVQNRRFITFVYPLWYSHIMGVPVVREHLA